MLFCFLLLIDPHGRRCGYEMIRCCSNFLRRGGGPECPGGLTTSMLIHILFCDIGGVFWTLPPNGARQNSRPYYVLCPLHATVLFHSVTAHQVPPKTRFLLFFSFPSAPETTIFLLTHRSATLPMGARGGACVIDAPRRCGGSVFRT